MIYVCLFHFTGVQSANGPEETKVISTGRSSAFSMFYQVMGKRTALWPVHLNYH